jgi:hypothetical protein
MVEFVAVVIVVVDHQDSTSGSCYCSRITGQVF